MKLFSAEWRSEIFPNDTVRRWFYYAVFRRAFSLFVNLLLIGIGCPKVGLAAMLIYISFFYFPRRYIGGFHAESPICCTIYSVFQVVFCMYGLFTLLYPWAIIGSAALAVFSGAAIYSLAPILPKNLKIDPEFFPVYRKKAIRVAFWEILVVFLFNSIGQQRVALCGSLGLACAASSLLIEKYLRKREGTS